MYKFFFKTVAVILTVPTFFALITPLLFTVAIDVLEDFQVIFLSVPDSFKVYLPPTATDILVLLSLGSWTFIVHLYFFEPTFAVMVAVPFFFAVTLPFDVTVATDFYWKTK